MRSMRTRLQGLRDQLPESTPPLPSSIAVWDDGGPQGLRTIGPPGSMAAIYVPEPGDPDPVATVHRLIPNAKIIVGVDPYLI